MSTEEKKVLHIKYTLNPGGWMHDYISTCATIERKISF